MKPRLPARPPPLAWTHWYPFFKDISEDRFLAAVERIGSLAGEQPFRTVQLDDGYQPAWGDWGLANPRFAHGLGQLAARIRERGLTPGLWLAPFVVQPGSWLARAHPDWLLRDHRGRRVEGGLWLHLPGSGHAGAAPVASCSGGACSGPSFRPGCPCGGSSGPWSGGRRGPLVIEATLAML